MQWVRNVRCDIAVSPNHFLSKRSGGRSGSALGESESPLSVGRTYHGLQDSAVMPNSDHLEGRERNESEYMPNTFTASDALKTRYCGKFHITVSTRGTSTCQVNFVRVRFIAAKSEDIHSWDRGTVTGLCKFNRGTL
jgi:hypothetical protein